MIDQHAADRSPSGHLAVDAGTATRAMSWLMGERIQTLPRDRALAQQLEKAIPWLANSAKINRAFHYQCARTMNERLGIDQFVTLSPGPYRPWRGQRADLQPPCDAVPGSAIVHVHTLAGTNASGPACQHPHTYAGPHQMLPLLRSPVMEAFDRRRPIGVLIDDVGPWTDSNADLRFGMARLRDWLPPGSAIALTHATDELLPPGRQRAARARHRHAANLRAQATGRPYRPRSRTEIAELLAPWPLANVDGPVATGTFFPDHAHAHLLEHHSGAYAAMALHRLHPDHAPSARSGAAGRGATAVPEREPGADQAGSP
ncbi:SAM-dependent methyltransferase [Streptomyces sp. CFMR 7]|uniref:SAM-dependent methyltransferase n=1 Tax=Streptomyces sp. CFMR 7 TaxID=1649184 RepID=UPI0011A8368B|nr:SAM-dependent methyltransferase [Streptomyces sp. CFMR 7]